MKLDVGCGFTGSGDVNCDLYIEDTLDHRHADRVTTIEPKKIKNFVQCDASYLPFQDGVFAEVFSGQVIEHVENPFRMFKELTRVSKSNVTIETVNRYGERFDSKFSLKKHRWLKQHHVSTFSRAWFNEAASKLGLKITDSYVLTYTYFPSQIITVFKYPFFVGYKFQKKAKQ